jgi:hypothetical protein
VVGKELNPAFSCFRKPFAGLFDPAKFKLRLFVSSMHVQVAQPDLTFRDETLRFGQISRVNGGTQAERDMATSIAEPPPKPTTGSGPKSRA